jgi:hypothetical protein
VGAVIVLDDTCRDRGSFVAGSVVERGNAGAETMGGVPWFEDARCREFAGSVVRRDPGGWKGVMAGVEVDEECAGVPTIAIELVGLSLAGMLKPSPRREPDVGDVVVCRLLRNCCLASTPARCP